MKTPLQELKQELIDMRFQANINGLDEFKNALNQVIVRIDSKIEKEKKVIMDACIYAVDNEYGFGDKQAQEYYDETFKDEDELTTSELKARIDAINKTLSLVKKEMTNSENAELKQESDFWNGWIEDFDETEIYCILRRDYNLDTELEMDRDALTPEQNAMVKSGLCLRYDIINNKIQFMLVDGSWL